MNEEKIRSHFHKHDIAIKDIRIQLKILFTNYNQLSRRVKELEKDHRVFTEEDVAEEPYY